MGGTDSELRCRTYSAFPNATNRVFNSIDILLYFYAHTARVIFLVVSFGVLRSLSVFYSSLRIGLIVFGISFILSIVLMIYLSIIFLNIQIVYNSMYFTVLI